MMENKRMGLVAVVLRWVVELLRRLGGSTAAVERRPGGGALAGNAGPEKPFNEPICPNAPNCPKVATAPLAVSV